MLQAHSDLIDTLGGGTVVAKLLSERAKTRIDRESVYKWKVNGIPWRWRRAVADLARTKRIRLPQDFFGAA